MLEINNKQTEFSSVLENSKQIILSSPSEERQKLTRSLLYGDVTMEQLTHQLNRVDSMIEVTLEHSVPLEESTQYCMVNTMELVKHRMLLESDMGYTCDRLMVNFMSNSINKDCGRDNINQSDIEDILINGNVDILNDVLTLIESQDTSKLSLDTLKFLIVSSVEDISNPDKINRIIADRVSKPLNILRENSIELSEAIEGISFMISTFESLYSCDSTRKSKFDNIKTLIESTIDEYLGLGVINRGQVYETVTLPVLETLVVSNLLEMAHCPDNEMVQLLNEFSRYDTMLNVYGEDILMEAKRHGGNVRKVTASVARRSKKLATSTAKKAQNAGKAIGSSKKKIYDPMEKFIENTFDKIKKADGNARKEIIIKGGIVPKVLRFIRRAIAIGGVGLVSPALAGISLLTYIALDKSLDSKAKRKVLAELEDELNIVNEKIEDSRGDEDKQKKYELMRIKNKLEKDILRIRHGLD